MSKPKPKPAPVPEHLCIQCMTRPAAPHNGGLCATCAPPLKVPKLREAMARRRAAAAQSQAAARLGA